MIVVNSLKYGSKLAQNNSDGQLVRYSDYIQASTKQQKSTINTKPHINKNMPILPYCLSSSGLLLYIFEKRFLSYHLKD